MTEPVVYENEDVKWLRSPSYNFNFNKSNGYFARWGKTKDDDPSFSPYGPEILDVEITTICHGPGGVICPYCYKSNNTNGTYMSFETFKQVFDKLPETTTQIAFGTDAQCTSNPDTYKIMCYTRDNGVIPNVTVADISDETTDMLAEVCGAVAVSLHHDKELCYDSVKKLTDRRLDQTNIHIVISNETLDRVYELFNDYLTDSRLEHLNAIVLLSLKQKGRGKKHSLLTQDQFNDIVNYAFDNDIPIGFDSCSYHKFLNSVQNHPMKEKFETLSEPCESFGIFSAYVNVYGHYFPCSFVEGEGEWKEGIDLLNIDNFLKDVWYCEEVNKWRNYSLSIDRRCPIFNI
jgi:hypothetical protein